MCRLRTLEEEDAVYRLLSCGWNEVPEWSCKVKVLTNEFSCGGRGAAAPQPSESLKAKIMNVGRHREATGCQIVFSALQESAFSLGRRYSSVLNANVRHTVINTRKHSCRRPEGLALSSGGWRRLVRVGRPQ